MTATRYNAETCWRRTRPRAFTLVELMVVVAIIGAMAAFAVPSYRRALEQSRVDIAGANLRAIWAAERLYWLQNQSYTTDLKTLQDLGLLRPDLLLQDPGADDGEHRNFWNNYFYYTVSGSGGITKTFTANAVASVYTGRTSTLAIDETGQLTGACGGYEPIDLW